MNRTKVGLGALGATVLVATGVVVAPAMAYSQPSDWCHGIMKPAPAGSPTTGAGYVVGSTSGVAVSPAPTPATPNGGPYVAVEATPRGADSPSFVRVCASSNAWNDYTHSQVVGGAYTVYADPRSAKDVTGSCDPNPKAGSNPDCWVWVDGNDPRSSTPGATARVEGYAEGKGTTVGTTGVEAGVVTTPFSQSALVNYLVVDWTPAAPGSAGVTKPCVWANGSQPAGPCGFDNLARVDLALYELVYGDDPGTPTARVTVLNTAIPVNR
jgi:hypothetical protein